MRSCRSAVLVALLLLAGCTTEAAHTTADEAVDTEAEAQELMRLSREWSDAAASGDMEAVLAYWADDAVMMAPGQPPIRGKEAIREYVAASGEIPGFQISWEPVRAHVSASGDLGYIIERNQISMTDSTGATITEHNKVVTIWERQPDGSWKNVVDMWNSGPSPRP